MRFVSIATVMEVKRNLSIVGLTNMALAACVQLEQGTCVRDGRMETTTMTTLEDDSRVDLAATAGLMCIGNRRAVGTGR